VGKGSEKGERIGYITMPMKKKGEKKIRNTERAPSTDPIEKMYQDDWERRAEFQGTKKDCQRPQVPYSILADRKKKKFGRLQRRRAETRVAVERGNLVRKGRRLEKGRRMGIEKKKVEKKSPCCMHSDEIGGKDLAIHCMLQVEK